MDVPLSESRKTEFRVLGAAELTGPEANQLLSVLARPKLVALLSYLAASVHRGFVRRDSLIRLFWGDRDPERARSALRQSLHHVRKSLGEEVLLTRGDEEVCLAFDRFWCDVAAFEEALEADERERALEAASRAREFYPRSLKVLYLQVRALAAMGRIEELNELLDEGTSLPPEDFRLPATVMGGWPSSSVLTGTMKPRSALQNGRSPGTKAIRPMIHAIACAEAPKRWPQRLLRLRSRYLLAGLHRGSA